MKILKIFYKSYKHHPRHSRKAQHPLALVILYKMIMDSRYEISNFFGAYHRKVMIGSRNNHCGVYRKVSIGSRNNIITNFIIIIIIIITKRLTTKRSKQLNQLSRNEETSLPCLWYQCH